MLGFDGAEADLVERWAEEGRLPTFASLRDVALTIELRNHAAYLPDVVWPELSTGRPGASLGWYRTPAQLVSGETKPRPVRADEVDLTAFWDIADRAGRRVAVFDVPWAGHPHGFQGVHVNGWGAHDRPFGAASEPPELLDELCRRFGPHPVAHEPATRTRCDHHDRSDAQLRELRDGLLRGIERRTEAIAWLHDRADLDLLYAVFTESHCAGHHFWHFFDESSPWHDPEAPDDLRRALLDVYVALDGALGELLSRAGGETAALALLSLGMTTASGCPELLAEVVVRLGYGSGREGTASTVRGRLPEPVKRLLRSVVRGGARQRLQQAGGSLPHPLESASTRAIALDNSPAGAIRLNVKGRDPFGSIEPGAEYDAACAELIRELRALENTETGSPAVESVVRADELFGTDIHPSIPDLLVSFDRSGGPVQSVRSPRVGTVSAAVRTPTLPRSGDHTDHTRVWLRGAGFEPGARATGDVLDLAPTVLRLLDVDVPDSIEGRPLDLRPAAV